MKSLPESVMATWGEVPERFPEPTPEFKFKPLKMGEVYDIIKYWDGVKAKTPVITMKHFDYPDIVKPVLYSFKILKNREIKCPICEAEEKIQ